jgi:ferrous iron transport protein B
MNWTTTAMGASGCSSSSQWPVATGLALMAWYVFAPQCASTLGVVKRETNSWLWPAVMLVYMTALAYIAALITFQVASAAGLG